MQGNTGITTVTANKLLNAGGVEISKIFQEVRGGGVGGVRWLWAGQEWTCVVRVLCARL